MDPSAMQATQGETMRDTSALDSASPPAPVAAAAPVPAPSAVAAPPPTQAAPSPDAGADLDEQREQSDYDQIVKRAKNGKITYSVPDSMTVGTPESVSVDTFGANASPDSANQSGVTGTGTLKVIPSMMVELSAPDNPEAFKIQADAVKTGNQFLPDSGTAEWVWTVTPLSGGGDPKKLKIDAYMVLNAKLPNGQPMTSFLKSFTVPVPVKVQPRLQTVGSFFASNWTTLLGYIVPSGAGVGFLLWLLSRRKSKQA